MRCSSHRTQFPEHIGDVLTVSPPPGGMALWAQVDPAFDLAEWCHRGDAAGVCSVPGRTFSVGGVDVQATRLGFTFLGEPDLIRAVRRMRRSLPERTSAAGQRT